MSFVFNRVRYNAQHYNAITDAWRHIFGDNFHFGYFTSPEMSLGEATDALVDRMASLADISGDSQVLDVGCGIGNPAFHLHDELGCNVTGISTSQKGVEQATAKSEERGVADKVRFCLADGLDNGFDDRSFDVAWVMESSHLMKDKMRLFSECFRVLRPGGVIVLCDIMLRRPFTMADRLGYFRRMGLGYVSAARGTIKAFGRNKMETFEFYEKGIAGTGFGEVEFIDISVEAAPTFECWKANISAHSEEIRKSFSQDQIDSFIVGTDMAKDFFERGISGYGIFKGVKA